MEREELQRALDKIDGPSKYERNKERIKDANRSRYYETREVRLETMRRYREAKKEELRQKRAARASAEPAVVAARARGSYEKHKQKRLDAKRSYYVENAETIKAKKRADRAARPAIHAERNRNNAHLRRQATPSWADYALMDQFYFEADRLSAETGVAHEVDHIVPIKHPLVCGLHCQFNLQVLTQLENRRKFNSFEVE